MSRPKVGSHVTVQNNTTGAKYSGICTQIISINDERDPGQNLQAAETPRIGVVFVVANNSNAGQQVTAGTVTTASNVPYLSLQNSTDTYSYTDWKSV